MLDEHPALRARLDAVESQAGKEALLELSEKIRIDATVFEHNMLRMRDEQVAEMLQQRDEPASATCALLRGALLDEHYLENELRIDHLLERMRDGQPVHLEHLRAPESHLRKDMLRLRAAREVGPSRDGDEITAYFPYTAMGVGGAGPAPRRARARSSPRASPGDLVECGHGPRRRRGLPPRPSSRPTPCPTRRVFVADRFRATAEGASRRPLLDGGVERSRRRPQPGARRVRPLRSARRARAVPAGRYPRHAAGRADRPDRAAADRCRGRGDEVRDVLDALHDRVAAGGFVVVEDGIRAARSRPSSTSSGRGAGSPSRSRGSAGRARPGGGRRDAPVAAARRHAGSGRRPGAARAGGADRRRSTSRSSSSSTTWRARRPARSTRSPAAYQEGIDDLDYEVIVVDNGSHPDQRLDADVRGELRAGVPLPRPARRRAALADRTR